MAVSSSEFDHQGMTPAAAPEAMLAAVLSAIGTGRQDADQSYYLVQALVELGAVALQERQQLIRRLLRDNGVTYSGFGPTRPWRLDPIPLAIGSADWRTVERGLQQRAELWRCLLVDLYGPQQMLRQGVLPAELVYSDPRFLRPCLHLPQPAGNYQLPLYSADLARAPDATLYVIDEHFQCPDGAGYALENRLVLSRVLPSLFRDARVHRLALFFRTLRNTLQALAWRQDGDGRSVLLTPGPASADYFEHAYLARYLGYPLVQSDDLTVRDGRVCLRTLDGLQPVDVVLRWLDDADCDPLELRQSSRHGVAGLLQAVRQRRVAVVNPPGGSVLENPGLAAWLPALCRALLGEDLLLPTPPTWWCGRASDREHVLQRLEQLVVRDLAQPGKPQDGRQLDHEQRARLAQHIRSWPYRYIARQPFTPAAAPILADGCLDLQPVVLRSFLVAAADDYVAMPGGLGRVADDSEARPAAGGGISKDAWVLASEPIQPLTLLASSEQRVAPAAAGGDLPSRVAENLFWLGRYAERAESLIRLLRVVLLERLEYDNDDAAASRTRLPELLRTLTWLTETFPGFAGAGAEQRLAAPDPELLGLLLDRQRNGSLAFTLSAMLTAARAVRDRISPDLWRVFTTLDDGLQRLEQPFAEQTRRTTADNGFLNQALAQLNQLLTVCATFTGLALDSMTHGQGWRFLMIGRRLERALQLQRLLRPGLTVVGPDLPLLEPLLNVCDSLMTYRSRYRDRFWLDGVLALLLLDESNPRAFGYQLRHLQRDIGLLPGQQGQPPYFRREPRLILEALTRLRLAELTELSRAEAGFRGPLDRLLNELGERLQALGEALADGYFRHADQPQQLVTYSDGD